MGHAGSLGRVVRLRYDPSSHESCDLCLLDDDSPPTLLEARIFRRVFASPRLSGDSFRRRPCMGVGRSISAVQPACSKHGCNVECFSAQCDRTCCWHLDDCQDEMHKMVLCKHFSFHPMDPAGHQFDRQHAYRRSLVVVRAACQGDEADVELTCLQGSLLRPELCGYSARFLGE